MGKLFEKIFSNAKHLNREDFKNTIDNAKIYNKTLTIPEAKDILLKLEDKLLKYDYEKDSNFFMNPRRTIIKSNIEERLNDEIIDFDKILESLFNFFEFISDEYPGNVIDVKRQMGVDITREEFFKRDKEYRDKGIICIDEEVVILEMIQVIKQMIEKYNIN